MDTHELVVALAACMAGAPVGVLVAMRLRKWKRKPVAVVGISIVLGFLSFIGYVMLQQVPLATAFVLAFLYAYFMEDAKSFKELQ